MNTKPVAPPLAIIRFALAMGVLLFGGVIVFLHTQPSWTPATSLPMTLGYMLPVLWLAGVIAAFVIRGLVRRETNVVRRRSLTIVGWACGEAPALFGAVLFMLTGEWRWYGFGLLAMLAAFALLPVPAQVSRPPGEGP